MSEKIYIDGNNAIYGKISGYAAKRLLEGNDIIIVNSNKVIITGSHDFILAKFRERRDIGSVRKGPFYPRTSDQILRRSIGDMLPKKKSRGKSALGRCRVHTGIPKDLKDVKFITVEKAMNNKVTGFVTLAEIAEHLGAKVRN